MGSPREPLLSRLAAGLLAQPPLRAQPLNPPPPPYSGLRRSPTVGQLRLHEAAADRERTLSRPKSLGALDVAGRGKSVNSHARAAAPEAASLSNGTPSLSVPSKPGAPSDAPRNGLPRGDRGSAVETLTKRRRRPCAGARAPERNPISAPRADELGGTRRRRCAHRAWVAATLRALPAEPMPELLDDDVRRTRDGWMRSSSPSAESAPYETSLIWSRDGEHVWSISRETAPEEGSTQGDVPADAERPPADKGALASVAELRALLGARANSALRKDGVVELLESLGYVRIHTDDIKKLADLVTVHSTMELAAWRKET